MIDIQNLHFNYKKSGDALFNNLNLNLKEGNIYGLLGKNGVGKTTLLKIMAGFLFPSAGTCSVLGEKTINRYPEILAEIYFLPEEFELPAISAKSFINLYAPFYPKFDYKEFERIVEEFEVDPAKKLSSLSFGQKKKFMVGFAIASRTSVVLMDEPTNGLDIPSKSKFRKVITSSYSEDRIFLISTHQVRDLENIIDPVIILDNGEVIFNYSLSHISQKLSVLRDDRAVEEKDVLYSEKVFGGHVRLVPSNLGSHYPIDLEFLFNAVLENRSAIVNQLS